MYFYYNFKDFSKIIEEMFNNCQVEEITKCKTKVINYCESTLYSTFGLKYMTIDNHTFGIAIKLYFDYLKIFITDSDFMYIKSNEYGFLGKYSNIQINHSLVSKISGDDNGEYCENDNDIYDDIFDLLSVLDFVPRKSPIKVAAGTPE